MWGEKGNQEVVSTNVQSTILNFKCWVKIRLCGNDKYQMQDNSFHREERGMGSGSSTVFLIYIFFLKLGNRVIGLHYIVVYTFLCA